MRTFCLLMAASSCAGALTLEARYTQEDVVPEDPGKVAIERALPLLAERNDAWITEHGCTSCHQVPYIVWALNDAREAGFEVDERLAEWNRWSVGKNLDETDGEKRIELARARTDVLWQLVLSGAAADTDDAEKTRADLIALLRDAREDDGAWKARGQLVDQRRLLEETHEVTTLWSRFALGESEPAAELTASGTVEHLALRAMRTRDAELIAQLLAAQNQDGGWPWLLTELSDAMGTGQALYALSVIGPAEHRAAIERAHAFLYQTQRADGSWKVPSTLASMKLEAYEVSNDWGSAWAVVGLVRTLPEE